MKRAVLLSWLVVLWLVLWRDLSPANLLSGAAIAILLSALFPVARAAPSEESLRPLALVSFIGYFLLKLVQSNIVLAREVVTKRDYTQTGIIAVPLVRGSDVAATMIANAITLTPGTVTLEIRRHPRTLYVHVLHLHDVERVRRDITELAERALRAFGIDPTEPARTPEVEHT